MAKPISATPVIKGKDAERIVREMERGTPDTPLRVRLIERADELYARFTRQADNLSARRNA